MKVTRRSIPKPADAPTPRKVALNAFKAAGRIIKATVHRQPLKRTPAARERALEICKGCEKWRGSTCGICGCVGKWKTWLETENCPLGRW